MVRTIQPVLLLLAAALLISCAAAFPVTVTDNYGNQITIKERPERIISLSPSNTEMLFAVGAGDTIVGVTTFDTYPADVENIEKVGGYVNVDNERIVDLEPDIVFAYYANGKETVDSLKKLGLTVIVLNPLTLDEIMDNIALIGKVTGNEQEAASVIAGMREDIEQIHSKTVDIPEADRPGVLYLVSFDPIYVAGRGSFPDSLISISGGRNVVEAGAWPLLTLEDIVELNPRIIICSGMGGHGDAIKRQIMDNRAMAATDAVRDDKVYVISDSNIIERPGPRIVQGLEEMYLLINPDSAFSPEEDIPGFHQAEEDKELPSSADTKAAPGAGILAGIVAIALSFLLIWSRQR